MHCRASVETAAAAVSPPRFSRRFLPLALVPLAITLAAIAGFGADLIVFGPQTYQRATGQPVVVTSAFGNAGPLDGYTLRVVNRDVSSAVIALNGRTVLDSEDFKRGQDKDDKDKDDKDKDKERDNRADDSDVVPLIERPVTLRAGNNQVSVELRSKPGTSLTVEIVRRNADTTPPTISATATASANANGWNNATVTVTFTCADADSGIATCPAPVIVSAEGAKQVISGTATDKAGNTASTSVTLNIDKTAPVVTAAASPAANANGWSTGPVVVTFGATDALSGVAPGSVSGAVTLSADGTNLSASGRAADLAGNLGSVTLTAINIDQTKPTISVALSPALNANGWDNSPVTAHFTCTDAGSGIGTCPPDQVIASQGANQTVGGTATDMAGNSASVTSAPFNIDLGAPAISVALSPPPNARGWNNSSVTAHFICTDVGSGIASCPPDQIIATDGANQTVSGTATDKAGNTASVTSVLFSLDQTKPTITVAVSPPPTANGWNNGAVTAHFTCTDAGSGIATCPPDQVIATEGANQTVSGTAADKAGNTASVNGSSFSIDLGAPTISVALNPPPNVAGWNNGSVVAHFTCTDAGSGIATCPADQTVSTDGANQTVTGTATDRAGNTASATSPPFSIDRTPPTILVELIASGISTAIFPLPTRSFYNGPVTAHFVCTDAGSGIASCPVDQILVGEGSNLMVTGTAIDKAGNTASVTSPPFGIDLSAPSISVTFGPPANANGWNNGAVTARFSCNDAGSGIESCPSDQTVSYEGANQTVSGTATDKAGNSATASVTVNIDLTAPVVTQTQSPAANAGGWNNGAVVVSFDASDALSGVAPGSLTTPVTLSVEGINLSTSGQATDLAGNIGSVTLAGIKIDRTLPTATINLSPPANAIGWNNGTVTVHFTCSDFGSGVAACPPDHVISDEGVNQTFSGTVADNAGNSASFASLPVNLDRTPPFIRVALSPLPTNGIYTGPVTAHFTCADSLSGVASCSPDQVVTTPGANQTVTGTTTDLADNTASVTSEPFTIQIGKPTITLTLSPSPNASGWNNGPVTAHFTCTENGSSLPGCPTDQVITTEGANQTVTGTVTDVAGNTVTASGAINIDTTPPVFAFGFPANGATLFTPTVTATGTATDTLSGIAGVTCNGAAATVSGTSVSCGVTLTAGANSISATATDVAGNTSSATLAVTYMRVPVVTITSPPNLSYFNISPTTVSGTVDDPTATVTINSVPAPVANGSFSIALPLAEGPNPITASATTAGAVGAASIEVNLDTTPPHVTITSPADQFVTAEASISVAGNINDIVVGTVNDQQAQVTVNGSAAQVANRTFLVTDVPLAVGPNVIQAIGRDRVGNAATTQITVTRQAATQSHIRLISGNNQTSAIGSTLAQLLTVALTDVAGSPVSNKPVMFAVTQNDGIVTAASGPPAVSAVVTTDAQGQAQVQWKLGNRAGAGGNTLEAYAVGFDGTAVFTATGTQGPAGKIVVDTGNDQVGAINQALPKPLIAVVIDDGNNRLAGVPVTFTVGGGGGSFGAEQTFTVNSDSDGRVAATLTLGMQEGNANNIVSATFQSNEGFPAAFSASGRAPGNPANTTISGLVLDNSNVPIPGVTIRAVLTNVLHSNASATQSAVAAQTDAQGQFSIASAPVGFVKLLVDGSTAQLTGTYPSLEYDMVTVAGQTNTVGSPIYILPLNSANQLCVTATTGGGTLTMVDAPGFSLTFGPGQVTFPGGSKSGCVSVTVVHGDKIPMVPGFGQQPRFIVTIQPSGAIFNPPAPITLPNVDGLKPREVTEMYSFDHDISSFVAIGTGVVSDDGQVIRSSQGVGVLKAGWHCGGNPGSPGTAASCAVCFFCPGSLSNCMPQGNGVACGNGGTCQFLKGCVGGSACPSGYTFTSGQCCPQIGTCIPPTCPAGQVVDPTTGTCVNSGCPPGYALIGGQCCLNGVCAPPSCPTGQVFDPTTGSCQPFVNTCTPQTAGQFCNAGGGSTSPGTCDASGHCVGSSPGQCGSSSGCSTCTSTAGGPPQCNTCPNGQQPVNGQCPACGSLQNDLISLLNQTQGSFTNFQAAQNAFTNDVQNAVKASILSYSQSTILTGCVLVTVVILGPAALPGCEILEGAAGAALAATLGLTTSVNDDFTKLQQALSNSKNLLIAANDKLSLLQQSQCNVDQNLVNRVQVYTSIISGSGQNSFESIVALDKPLNDEFSPWTVVADLIQAKIFKDLGEISQLLGAGKDITKVANEVVNVAKDVVTYLLGPLNIFK